MQVHHFAFEVSRLEESIRFYTDMLGFTPVFKKEDPEHNEAYAFLDFGSGTLELLQVLDRSTRPAACEKPGVRPPYCPHIAFETDDMTALVAELKARGFPFVDGPFESKEGGKWVYFSDPDGNIIEFIQK